MLDVGGIDDQVAFACEIMRVGRGLFVQTPNRYFPVEPHFLTPFVQFLPPKARVRMSRNLTVWGLVTRRHPPLAGGGRVDGCDQPAERA